MSGAYEDFWTTVINLRQIAGSLGDVMPGTLSSRSLNHLRLNGLHVVTFAALEDFVRRRAHEVIAWLGSAGVSFDKLPEKLQILILQGTIEGISYSLSRTDKDERVTLLQLQGLLLGNTGERNQNFSPSEYFFGRSSSNLSKDDLRSLLEALGLGDKLACLNDVSSQIAMPHLGAMDGIFTRLAKNRHSAAHAFGADYKWSDFKSDLSSALPIFAFAFDTCISQCALAIRKTVLVDEVQFKGFSVSSSNIRILEFDSTHSSWLEFRNGKQIKKLAKGQLKKRIESFQKGELAADESILLKGELGAVDGWIQPLRAN